MITFAIVSGEHDMREASADLRFLRAPDNGVDSHATLGADAHARLEDAKLADCVSRLFALDHGAGRGQSAGAHQLAGVDFHAEPVGDIVEQRGAEGIARTGEIGRIQERGGIQNRAGS